MVKMRENDVTVDDVRDFARKIIEMAAEYETEDLIDFDTAIRIVREIREIVSQVEAGRLHPSEAIKMLSYKMGLVEGMAEARRIKPQQSTLPVPTREEKVTIRESHRGLSRSSEYHFVIEGDKLVHISRYSISQKKIEDKAEYIVDLSRLRGKKVVKISSTNSGILCMALVYPAEDLALKYDERRREEVSLSFLNSFVFAHLTYREKRFLQTEWKQYYLPMIEELHKLIRFMTTRTPYVILPSLISCQIESRASYPLSFLIPYSEYARRRSLEGLTKEIHQLWITMRILSELDRVNMLEGLNLNFTQSPYHAIASFHCRSGLCSLWYEFDMNPITMCGGMLWYTRASSTLKQFYQRVENVLRRKGLSRAPLRPDIAILLGGASCEDLVRGFKVKVIIECKNQDYTYWAKDVDTQIIPYKEIFQSDIMVLASLKKIPEYVKEHLDRYGVTVIDEVYPGGKGINELLYLMKTL